MSNYSDAQKLAKVRELKSAFGHVFEAKVPEVTVTEEIKDKDGNVVNGLDGKPETHEKTERPHKASPEQANEILTALGLQALPDPGEMHGGQFMLHFEKVCREGAF